MNRNSVRIAASLLLGLVLLPSHSARAQTFSEPYTVFYGKVLGTASAQPFLITSGQLTWTIQRADGETVTLQTSLYSFNDDTLSYKLNVPHSAFALGLSSDAGGIPLPPVPEVHVHASITVDGEAAVLLGPAGTAFTTEQLLRTATYRLDLGLDREALDSDGDGMSDEWEDRYGLNKQDPNDGASDLNGDGLSALDAYLRGLDPTLDARHPALLTEEIVVYPAGPTGVLLDTADLDSSPAQLTYTLTALPTVGALTLRNSRVDAAQPDTLLVIGDEFTQDDLLNGRLVYDHDGSAVDPGFFDVEVRDENPEHPADEGQVRLLRYAPADLLPAALSDMEARHLDNHFYASTGLIVLDGSPAGTNFMALAAPSAGLRLVALDAYQAAYGDDRPYALSGGTGAALRGGHQNDVLEAGVGGGILTGGPGADRFVARSFGAGLISITDFSVEEGDVVDFSRLPKVDGAYAHQHLKIAKVDGVNYLQTDLDGDGVGFTDLAVALTGLSDAEADLYGLIESGNLLVGDVALAPRVSVTASQPQASENGPTAGAFTLTRQGSLTGALTVNVAVSGSAQNGVDYELTPVEITMPAGVASVDVPIVPYQDGNTEPSESVQLTVTSGTGYLLGTASQAVVTIQDLLMLVEIEVVEPIAVKDTATPAQLLITRRDVINRDVIIRLTMGGTATAGTDYTALSTLVYMAPNQTVAFVTVSPTAAAQITGGTETVSVTIRPDANYLVVGEGTAQVLLIERMDSFNDWRTREFPAAVGDAETFAAEDSGGMGASHFQRYAFGLDPHDPVMDGMPRLVLVDGQPVVTFRKPTGLTDVQYRVTATARLTGWSAYAIPVTPITAPAGSSDPTRVYYRVSEGSVPTFISVEAEWMP